MEKIFILILVVAVAIFVSFPLFRHRFEKASASPVPDSTDNPTEIKLKRLNFEKESLLRAIKEIDFDHELGKLSKDDHQELYTKYRTRAALILREIDGLKMKDVVPSLDEEIEREIIEVRKARKGYDQDLEKEILSARRSRAEDKQFYCSGCGGRYQMGDRFCSKCGARLI